MMEQIVSWETVRVKITCNVIMDISKYLPQYYSVKEYENEAFSKRLIIKTNEPTSVKWNEETNTLILCIRELNSEVYSAINVLLNVLIKRTLQEMGKYVLHASGVVVNNRVVLMFGSSGSGKTAVAMAVSHSGKASFLSNGSTIVCFNKDKVKVCGTYKPGIKLRKSTLKQYDEELCNFVFSEDEEKNGFDCKRVLSPVELGFVESKNTQVEQYDDIEFYIIQLDSLNKELKHRDNYDYKVSMQLYEDLNREINGSEIYISIDGVPLYVPSFDNKKLCIRRTKFINYFMKRYFRGVLMGGLDEVQAEILKGGIAK